jgi:hypothetical protein
MAKPNGLPVVPHYTTPYTCHFIASCVETPFGEYMGGYHEGVEPNIPVLDGEPLPEDGVIELGAADSVLRYRTDGDDWKTVDTGLDGVHKPSPGRVRAGLSSVASKLSPALADRITATSYETRAIDELVTALRTGTESELSARNALAAEELIFASWESARRRGRVVLPLDIDDNPLESMIAEGVLLTGSVE